MLIDEFLPEYDVSQGYGTEVSAPVDRAWAAVRDVDLGASAVSRWLFRARGIPAGRRVTLEHLLARGFVLLAEDPPRELLLGLVARPWTLSAGIRRTDAQSFRAFHDPGYAKIAWNFTVAPHGGGSRVHTETRVLCTDAASLQRYRRYWRFIAPFSGLIRREALRSIKRGAESPSR